MILMLLSMVMFRPSSLNIFVISFLIMSALLPVMSLKIANPSSQNRSIYSFPYLFDKILRV